MTPEQRKVEEAIFRKEIEKLASDIKSIIHNLVGGIPVSFTLLQMRQAIVGIKCRGQMFREGKIRLHYHTVLCVLLGVLPSSL